MQVCTLEDVARLVASMKPLLGTPSVNRRLPSNCRDFAGIKILERHDVDAALHEAFEYVEIYLRDFP